MVDLILGKKMASEVCVCWAGLYDMIPGFSFVKVTKRASIREGAIWEAVFKKWHKWIGVCTKFYDLVGHIRIDYEFDFFCFFVDFSLKIVRGLEVGEFGWYSRYVFKIL